MFDNHSLCSPTFCWKKKAEEEQISSKIIKESHEDNTNRDDNEVMVVKVLDKMSDGNINQLVAETEQDSYTESADIESRLLSLAQQQKKESYTDCDYKDSKTLSSAHLTEQHNSRIITQDNTVVDSQDTDFSFETSESVMRRHDESLPTSDNVTTSMSADPDFSKQNNHNKKIQDIIYSMDGDETKSESLCMPCTNQTVRKGIVQGKLALTNLHQKKGYYRDMEKDKAVFQQLKQAFLPYTTRKSLEQVLHNFNTQLNESLNNKITYLAPKNRNYSKSMELPTRVSLAIGMHNLGEDNFTRRIMDVMDIDRPNQFLEFMKTLEKKNKTRDVNKINQLQKGRE